MPLSDDAGKALKAKAYITDVLAGLVPSDPDFDEIWALIPDHIAEQIDVRHAPLADEFVDLADKVRAIKWRHAEAAADAREG